MKDASRLEMLPQRKARYARPEDEAWEVLARPEAAYGFLAVTGVEEGWPYVTPLNFAADREARAIYVHTTRDRNSKRRLCLERDDRVCFSVVIEARMMVDPAGRACGFSMSYRSAVAFGRAREITEGDQKAGRLNFLMKQKAPAGSFKEVTAVETAKTAVYEIAVESLTCRVLPPR